jgi:hypothetical protein
MYLLFEGKTNTPFFEDSRATDWQCGLKLPENHQECSLSVAVLIEAGWNSSSE